MCVSMFNPMESIHEIGEMLNPNSPARGKSTDLLLFITLQLMMWYEDLGLSWCTSYRTLNEQFDGRLQTLEPPVDSNSKRSGIIYFHAWLMHLTMLLYHEKIDRVLFEKHFFMVINLFFTEILKFSKEDAFPTHVGVKINEWRCENRNWNS